MDRYPNGNPRRVEERTEKNSLYCLKTFHFNGIRSAEIPYHQGKAHGSYKRWNSNGDLQESGEYVNGILEGPLYTWFKDRKKESEVHMMHGKRHGKKVIYHGNGSLAEEQFYTQDTASGIWKKWDSQQHLLERNGCHTGNDTGSLTRFHTDGSLTYELHCRQGIYHGQEKEWYPGTDQLKFQGFWKQGKKDSLWQWWHADGSLWKEQHYKQNQRHHSFKQWNLKKQLMIQASFQKGTGHLTLSCQPPRAMNCADSNWQNGKLHGLVAQLDSTQQIWQREQWQQGNKQESQIWFLHEPGDSSHGKTLIRQGAWEKGKRHGIWRNWFRNGILKDSLLYQKGELWGRQFHFDSTGHLYMIRRHHGKAGQVIVEKLDPQPLKP